MLWMVKALGGSSGRVSGFDELLKHGRSVCFGQCPQTLESEDGKLGDSEDSFLYCYCIVRAGEENFRLEAALRATASSETQRNQSGYGLMLADTDASDSQWARHRNQLFIGRIGKEPTVLARIVAGYKDPTAEDGSGRIVDRSRRFEATAELQDGSGAEMFSVEKTDEGIFVGYQREKIFIPGCDFLLKQDKETVCVGIALARGMRLEIEDISFETSPGRVSSTPDGIVRPQPNEYPFAEELLHFPTEAALSGEIFVSQDGSSDGSGTREAPMELRKAVLSAAPGAVIRLLDGIYELKAPVFIPRKCSGTASAPITLKAENRRKAVLSGRSAGELPLMVFGGDFWQVEGLVFRESMASGAVICGSRNVLLDCEACGNGDSGFLVIAPAGAEKSRWPAYNQVCGCDSHDNRDPAMENADGFGAKLRIGKGNLFYNCMAFRNADDGFDLYSKSLFGPTAPVEVDSCVACDNGFSESGGERTEGTGVGFKLGGENQAAAHEVWNCLALRNARGGFASNSNPDCRLHYCTGGGNGKTAEDDFRMYSRTRKKEDYVLEGIVSLRTPSDKRDPVVPERAEDGFLDWNAAPLGRRKNGARAGAQPLKKKKIMILISSVGGGGAERVAVRLANRFSARHDVLIVYDTDKEKTYPIDEKVRLCKLSVEVGIKQRSRLEKSIGRKLFLYKTRRAIRKIQKENGIDVVISMMEEPNLKNAISGGNVRRIMSERNDPTRKPRKYYLKGKFCFAVSDYVVFQTEHVRRMFSERVRQKSCVIPNPTEIGAAAKPMRAKKIVSAGRLHPQKNQKMLLRAFALFHASHREYKLFLYGDGSLREELIAYSEELGVGESVVFEPFREDIYSAIADAEMFVLSSDYEGMSNALMEAMMMGIACVSTACTGSTDLIDDGVDGLLVPVGDDHALADAMTRLAEDEALRKTLEQNAVLGSAAYSTDRICRRWERLL